MYISINIFIYAYTCAYNGMLTYLNFPDTYKIYSM